MHEHVSADGTRTEFPKTRGGDQGDALTSLIFPLTYKSVTEAVSAAIVNDEPNSIAVTYPDDVETGH